MQNMKRIVKTRSMIFGVALVVAALLGAWLVNRRYVPERTTTRYSAPPSTTRTQEAAEHETSTAELPEPARTVGLHPEASPRIDTTTPAAGSISPHTTSAPTGTPAAAPPTATALPKDAPSTPVSLTATPTPAAVHTPAGTEATPTVTPTMIVTPTVPPGAPTATPTPTTVHTPAGTEAAPTVAPTATATPTVSPGAPTATPTPTPTPTPTCTPSTLPTPSTPSWSSAHVNVISELGYKLPGCLVSIYDQDDNLLNQGYTDCQGSLALNASYEVANWKLNVSPPPGFEPLSAYSHRGQVVDPATVVYQGQPSGVYYDSFTLRSVEGWITGINVYDAAADEPLPGIWVSLLRPANGGWELHERKQTESLGCVYFNFTDPGSDRATWEIRVEVPEGFEAVEAVPINLGPLAPGPQIIDAATLRFDEFRPGSYSGNSFILRSINFWVIKGEVYQIFYPSWEDLRPVVEIYSYDEGWKLEDQTETDQLGRYRFVFRDSREEEATWEIRLVAPPSDDPLITYRPIKAWSSPGGEVIDPQTIRYTDQPCCRLCQQEFALLENGECEDDSWHHHCVGAQAIDGEGKGIKGVGLNISCDTSDLDLETYERGWAGFFGAQSSKRPPMTCELTLTSVPDGYVPVHAWSDRGGTVIDHQTIRVEGVSEGTWIENYLVLEERD